MKLLRLKGENFRSFERFDLDLNVDGLIAVVGPNGAGKTSLFAAVEWALYGGRPGAGSVPVRRDDCDEDATCWVELDFESGGRVYRVHRIDRKKASLVERGPGAPLSTTLRDTSRQAAAVLGLTQEMFCGTFYARQKEVQALAETAKASDRREQLERLLGIEHLRLAADLANRDAREQKLLYDALAADAPDVEALKADLERAKSEVSRSDVVRTAKAEVKRLQEAHRQAKRHADQLAEQATQYGRRQVAARAADGELAREQLALDNLRAQFENAMTALRELSELEPIAARVDELTARERELDLRREKHEHAQELRDQQAAAMKTVARASEELERLAPVNPDPIALAEQVSHTQAFIAEHSELLRAATAIREAADREVIDCRGRVAAAEQAAQLSAELERLGTPDAELDQARERYQELRGQRAEVVARRDHDIKHRDALLAGGETAVCPTCKRKLEGTYDELIAAFDADIATYDGQIEKLDADMEGLKKHGDALKKKADRAGELRARLNALGDSADVDPLRTELAEAEARAQEASNEEARLATELDERKTALPALVKNRDAASAAAQKRGQLESARAAAQRDVDVYTEQLAKVSVNGYDPAAHMRLRTELAEVQEISRRCAALRTAAQSAQLLEGRVRTQEEKVAAVGKTCRELHAHADEKAVPQDAQELAQGERDRLEGELGDAQAALRAAEQQELLDSQAVQNAQHRLAEARKAVGKLKRERQEWTWRKEVAAALSAYREDASRRARPTLEQETSLLLGPVTRGRYGAVRLTDAYLLEVADRRRLHPLKRFSGGEQDLASLCLRLALSRTLAHQRGVEAGFIILDEVFSSQDAERRRLLLDQLRDLMQREFRQIFVVSHTDDVVEHCSMHIDVSCETGMSVAAGPRT